MSTPIRKMVVIEDSLLVSMAQNQSFLTEFPFLGGLTKSAAKKGGCGSCGSANREKGQVLNAAKATIAGLGPEKKRRLLQLLNTEKARVIYNDGSGTKSLTIEGAVAAK